MTVAELIGLNPMITDVAIEVRENGCKLVDALHIGLDYGVKPPHPQQLVMARVQTAEKKHRISVRVLIRGMTARSIGSQNRKGSRQSGGTLKYFLFNLGMYICHITHAQM